MKTIIVGAAAILLVLILIKLREQRSATVNAQTVTSSSGDHWKTKNESSQNEKSQSAAPVVGSTPPFMIQPDSASFDAMRNNPENRRNFEESILTSIDLSHGEFFSTLPIDQKEKLRALLFDHRVGIGELFVPGGMPPNPDKLTEFERAHETSIRQLLGEGRYREYTEYKSAIPSILDVTQFEERASGLGIPISADQKNQVLAILKSERTAIASKMDSGGSQIGEVPPSLPGPGSDRSDPLAELQALRSNQESADQAALSKAEKVLSNEQADLLLNILREKLERMPPGVKPPQLIVPGAPLPLQN